MKIKKLKIIAILLCSLIIPNVIYYSAKFYLQHSLNFNENYILGWTILMSLIIISLILNCVVLNKFEILSKQNEQLKSLITQFHCDNLSASQNTREIILDGFNEINEVKGGD